jgi:HAE1 family hydrophobic/amphiphilic exporter-1
MLVDNSIVVLENIVRHKEQGHGVLEAARRGASEVAGAVTAATLTTVAVFFPMVFITGIAGQLFRDQALTVTFALLFSLAVALTLIPMLAARGAPPRYADAADETPPGRVTRWAGQGLRLLGLGFAGISWATSWAMRPLVWVFQGFYRLAARVYAPLLASSLRHRWLVMLIATAAFASSLALAPRLGYELLPQLAQGEFSVNVRLPAGAPLSAWTAALQLMRPDNSAVPAALAWRQACARAAQRMASEGPGAERVADLLHDLLERRIDEAQQALVQAETSRFLLIPLGIMPFFMLMFLVAFEILVAFLQAYIFVVLAAVYIASSVEPAH